jgi:hypothetical protein
VEGSTLTGRRHGGDSQQARYVVHLVKSVEAAAVLQSVNQRRNGEVEGGEVVHVRASLQETPALQEPGALVRR